MGLNMLLMTRGKGVVSLCWVGFYMTGTWYILGQIQLRPSSGSATSSL